MKQGNPTKKLGLIGLISAMLRGAHPIPETHDFGSLSRKKNILLTNGGAAPIPGRSRNQRQKRKLYRQTHCS